MELPGSQRPESPKVDSARFQIVQLFCQKKGVDSGRVALNPNPQTTKTPCLKVYRVEVI